jgi:hypothetical protein
VKPSLGVVDAIVQLDRLTRDAQRFTLRQYNPALIQAYAERVVGLRLS